MRPFGIVLLVSERSGGNLLRTLIGNHSLVSAPVAPHLLAEFYDCRKYYGDLRDRENVEKLGNDMIALANHPYHDWNLKYRFDAQAQDESPPSSVVSAMDRVYRQKAKEEGKRHYCSKGIDSFRFVDQIRAEVPSMKFVHLVRDPRDHVASWMKRPWALLTAYDAVVKWKKEQETLIDAVQNRKLSCLSVTYEELITETPGTMGRVLQSVGLPSDEKCFATDRDKNSGLGWNPYWENLSKPVMSGNREKFRKELSYEEIEVVETVADREMRFFGYKCLSERKWRYTRGYEERLAREREERRAVVERNPFGELQEKVAFSRKMREERRESGSPGPRKSRGRSATPQRRRARRSREE